jgi:2-keto-3-deoxy-L-rhamnonate aldolase RhmA
MVMSLKGKILKKQKTLGTWITVYHRAFVEIVADLGYDWACLDIEHSSVDLDQLATLISVGRGRGLDMLVRLSELNTTLIKRVMDSGASGIIVPMINSREQADLAYKSMHYPPRGIRGVGLSTAQKYGGGFEDYKKWLTNESVLIVQIEHKEAVQNLESILSHEGVDGFLVGPYDLSASCGKPGDFESSEFKTAMLQIEKVQQTLDKARGIHIVEPDPKLITNAINKGYNFIAYSFETRLFELRMKEAMKEFSR